MLHRSSSSRRRRASRSAASSPHGRSNLAPSVSPARRASVAVTLDVEVSQSPRSPRRTPRHSLAPDLDVSPSTPDLESPLRDITIPILDRSPRNTLAPDIPSFNKSPRHSLTPDFNRSPRNSLVPDPSSRSPRNSLIPEGAISSRNTLGQGFDKSPRHSLAPDGNYGSRMSLNPSDFNRSPRNSLVPDSARSPRNSLVPDSANWNQHRNSISVETSRSPRHSLTPLQADFNRSPRGSIAPDTILSPRTSPRGSLGDCGRSPRGSIAGLGDGGRSPRGSVAGLGIDSARSPRGSIAGLTGDNRSARGSLTLTFQEPPSTRRASDDNGNGTRGRSSSPYGGRGSQVNAAFTWDSSSRRASSSVSQVSGDEAKRLCLAGGVGGGDMAPPRGLSTTLTTYGSVAYQLKDANMEASSTCDFVCRAITIVNRTVIMTILLGCLSTLPIVMLIMGVQFLRDCPREPNIPIYMIVGGGLGGVKLAWLLHGQLSARSPPSTGPRIAAFCLTLILLGWFALGNYWIVRIKWPDFQPTLFEPNRWCHKTLYTFALVHIFIVYSFFALVALVIVVLASCQFFGCPWLGPGRFK